jgi:hypothetical protein
MALQFPTRAERPGRLPHAASLREGVWPEFMYHDPVLERLFDRAISEDAEFHFYVWDDEREEVVGAGNAVPASWDGEPTSLPDRGVDAVVEARFAEGAPDPNVLCALQIVIVAPVRPTLKHRYPLVRMERYIRWRGPDGTHLDPWLRTHERLGAEIVKVAPQSMRVPGSVGEWEEWAEMTFPETGAYVVPGALVPGELDRERDEGLYVEPNVWMVHKAD